jgi:hypothetical protein
MSTRRARLSIAVGLAVLAPSLGACATTIEDGADQGFTPTTMPPATATTIPTGGIDRLFGQILDTGANLGNDVATGDMRTARAKLADIEATWQGIEGQLGAFNDEVRADLERLVDLFGTAVQRKRPADADKAMRYLPMALEALDVDVR